MRAVNCTTLLSCAYHAMQSWIIQQLVLSQKSDRGDVLALPSMEPLTKYLSSTGWKSRDVTKSVCLQGKFPSAAAPLWMNALPNHDLLRFLNSSLLQLLHCGHAALPVAVPGTSCHSLLISGTFDSATLASHPGACC